MVSVYPIAQPQYGGPIRSRAIHDALRDQVGALAYVAVHPRHRVKVGPHDIAVSPATQDRISRHPYLADLICGEAIYADAAVKTRITRFIHEFRPDVILIEQVYPFFGLKLLLAELHLSVRLVFSSQNIEHLMKPSMYEAFGAAPDAVDELTRRLRQAEEDLAVQSALVVAVSQQDRDALREMGAQRDRAGSQRHVATAALQASDPAA